MNRVRKHYFRYEVRVVFWEIILALIGTVLTWWLLRTYVHHLNLEAFAQAVVSLNAGIIIAVFVAVFHSTDENIERFRAFKEASRQLYQLFILNSVIACLAVILITNFSPEAYGFLSGQTLTIFGTFLAIFATGKNVMMIFDLLSIYFRK